MAAPQPPSSDAPPPPTRHTAIGIALNLTLLALIAYGFWQSEDYRWAWLLVAVPILVVTLTYARHLGRKRN
jgi:tellurite resistance protein TehA-like permease